MITASKARDMADEYHAPSQAVSNYIQDICKQIENYAKAGEYSFSCEKIFTSPQMEKRVTAYLISLGYNVNVKELDIGISYNIETMWYDRTIKYQYKIRWDNEQE